MLVFQMKRMKYHDRSPVWVFSYVVNLFYANYIIATLEETLLELTIYFFKDSLHFLKLREMPSL